MALRAFRSLVRVARDMPASQREEALAAARWELDANRAVADAGRVASWKPSICAWGVLVSPPRRTDACSGPVSSQACEQTRQGRSVLNAVFMMAHRI